MTPVAVQNPSLIAQFKAARRVSAPLLAVTTPDAAATIQALAGAAAGAPVLVWDAVGGVTHLIGSGDASKEAASIFTADGFDPTMGNPVELLRLARQLPEESLLFLHMANRYLAEPAVLQALWNLRDLYKADHRTVVLLGPTMELPPEIAGDVVVLDEPLPDAATLEAIIREVHESADVALTPESLVAAVEAVQGLPAFAAEQVVAMSLRQSGLDIPKLWDSKRKSIEQTPGLKVYRGGETFADIGGVSVVKSFIGRIMGGNAAPAAIVFLDEIEKSLAGAAGGNDSSGVTQDQLGALLSHMQDNNAVGAIFVGPPGAAKSAVAKAAGNEAGVPTIQLDLGGMKGGIVGQSEANMRGALKVIDSVSNGRALWIATSNNIADLPVELRRRFTLGVFFFDLPDTDERASIWPIMLRRYGLDESQPLPADEGWTGAEIRQCVDMAWRLNCPVTEAAAFVVPIAKSAPDTVARLRHAADGKYLSASYPGTYRRPEEVAPPTPAGRRIRVED